MRDSSSATSIEMTRHHMARSHQLLLRLYRGALRLGQRTARMEPAAAWGVDGGGHFAAQNNFFAFDIRVAREGSRKQRLGIRVQRVVEQLLGAGFFNDLTEI